MGRKPDPRTAVRYREALKLRTQGWKLEQIGTRLGLTTQGVWRILRDYGHGAPAPGTVTCSHCKRRIAQGTGLLQSSGPVLCLSCLGRRPDASFGQRLKAFRMAAGLTQTALSEKSGVAQVTISGYEQRRLGPQWHNLIRLVRV